MVSIHISRVTHSSVALDILEVYSVFTMLYLLQSNFLQCVDEGTL